MKTKYWVLLIFCLLLLCGLAAVLLIGGDGAGTAEIYSDGKLIRTVSLRENQTFTVENGAGGWNTVVVRDGKIGVTDASCPDGYCRLRGFCSGNPQIVCLPNRLVISFPGASGADAASG